jgi:hypothetical protein
MVYSEVGEGWFFVCNKHKLIWEDPFALQARFTSQDSARDSCILRVSWVFMSRYPEGGYDAPRINFSIRDIATNNEKPKQISTAVTSKLPEFINIKKDHVAQHYDPISVT